MVDLKSEAQLWAMSSEQLEARLKDVSITLAKMRKQKKFGYQNPTTYKQIRQEKGLILRIQKEKEGDHGFGGIDKR